MNEGQFNRLVEKGILIFRQSTDTGRPHCRWAAHSGERLAEEDDTFAKALERVYVAAVNAGYIEGPLP